MYRWWHFITSDSVAYCILRVDHTNIIKITTPKCHPKKKNAVSFAPSIISYDIVETNSKLFKLYHVQLIVILDVWDNAIKRCHAVSSSRANDIRWTKFFLLLKIYHCSNSSFNRFTCEPVSKIYGPTYESILIRYKIYMIYFLLSSLLQIIFLTDFSYSRLKILVLRNG